MNNTGFSSNRSWVPNKSQNSFKFNPLSTN